MIKYGETFGFYFVPVMELQLKTRTTSSFDLILVPLHLSQQFESWASRRPLSGPFRPLIVSWCLTWIEPCLPFLLSRIHDLVVPAPPDSPADRRPVLPERHSRLLLEPQSDLRSSRMGSRMGKIIDYGVMR